jgi:DNA polymerase-1
MGVHALKKAIGSNFAEAQTYLAEYFAKYHTLAAYLERTKGFAREHGYTETLFGRRRYFEGITSSLPFVRAQAERMALNAPIQGTQSDIIKIAMVKVHEFIQKHTHDAHLVLQVHDELVYELKDPNIAKDIQKIMEDVLPLTETGGVPLKVDGALGESWGETTRI